MSPSERIPDEEIDSRMKKLDDEGFPPDRTVRMAEDLAHRSWGARAEEALEQVIVHLPRAQLNLLASRHVMARPDSRPEQDYVGLHQPHLVQKMRELGVPLHDRGDEWTSELPTGTKLNLGYGPAGEADDQDLDNRGEALCRIALYAVWLGTMRKRETEAREGS